MIDSSLISDLHPHEQVMVRAALRTLATLSLVPKQTELDFRLLINRVATLSDEDSLVAIREHNRKRELLVSFHHFCETEGNR